MGQGRVKAKGFVRKESRRSMAQEARKKRRREERKKGIKIERIPKTIDNKRVFDETKVENEEDIEMIREEQLDEFSSVISGRISPKVMITTTMTGGAYAGKLGRELAYVIPNGVFKRRRGYSMSSILKTLKKKHYTMLILVEQGVQRKRPDGLWMINLPHGPTAHFRIGTVRYRREIPDVGRKSDHYPDLNLYGFKTRLGRRISRMFQSLFPPKPEYYGRQIITFHNQRDWIFFRQHRFIFDDPKTPRVQELGPRFSLYLLSLQDGTMQRTSPYEYIPKAGTRSEKLRFIL
ncbi:putative ribosome production factor 1 [Monocercomonoides exilis]|uniref:putative ribosome production factor 1 n=1 Tax=Monocercomonoides exilis TaxID=2049356 RepID=UPI00355A3B07|nr:putative ribosome production factor 1 [Monocercomonoides exilis]